MEPAVYIVLVLGSRHRFPAYRDQRSVAMTGGVICRLGRLIGAKGPGLILLDPGRGPARHARQLAQEWRAKREPARAALDRAITKFRKPS